MFCSNNTGLVSTAIYIEQYSLNVGMIVARAHFSATFGPVSDVEVVRERDGSHRGFAFVTFLDKKHADLLKKQHHTNIGNVRMEAKPCVPPRLVS